MKSIFLSMLAIAALASCTTENFNIDPPGPQNGDKMEVKLTISSGPLGTRAGTSGTPADNAGDKTINDITVFGVSQAGAIITKKYFDNTTGLADGTPGTGTKTTTFTTTDQAESIYIIANIGEDLTQQTPAPGQFFSVNTLTSLQTATVSLLDNTNPKQTQGKVLMSGNNTVSNKTDGHADANVTLNFIASKIILKSLVRGTTSLGTYDTDFKLTKAIMSHVNTSAYYIGDGTTNSFIGLPNGAITRNLITPVFATGLPNSPCVDKTVKDFSHNITVAPGGFDPSGQIDDIGYWYVFENPTTSTTNTTLLIEYQYKENVGDVNMTTYYFPVTFSTSDKGAIEPGKAYAVTVTFNGSCLPGDGGGGGVPDPDTEVIPTDVAVTVTPTDWSDATVNKPFN